MTRDDFTKHDLKTLTLYATSQGYITAVYRSHPYADSDSRVKFHRLVMENKLGRYLQPSELVHHKDGNRANNRTENLQLVSAAEHGELHRNLPPARECLRCGQLFSISSRTKTKYSRAKYCCIECAEAAKAAAISEKIKQQVKAAEENAVSGKCVHCNNDLPTNRKKFCSYDCMYANRGMTKPDAATLKRLVWSAPTRKIAVNFGVTDKAVEKWCKQYGIEKPPRGYWARVQAGKITTPA